MADETPQAGTNDNNQQFSMQKIYVKDVSFETPNTPSIFKDEWTPDINMQLRSQINPLEQNLFEVVLTVTVTAKKGDTTGYLVEVQQAGIFHISGFPTEQLNEMLGAYCPSTLYPFAREAVSDLVTKGGFPQILISPANFDAIYAKRKQQLEKSDESTTH